MAAAARTDALGLARASRRSRVLRQAIASAVTHAVLLVGAVGMLAPFVWMVSTSLKREGDVFAFPPEWIPNPVQWGNYAETWRAAPFDHYLINTVFVSVSVTLLDLTTSALAAYSFSRLRFAGRDRLFLLYLGTLMIPGQVVIIPRFLIVKELGWIDSYQALILPAAASAFGTFWMRQHFLTMPVELEDAARVDGASRWRIYYSIMLPLAGPVLATLGVFAFLAEWNSFLWPLIVVNSMEMRTLALVLRFFQGSLGIQWNLMMAAASISLVPVMLVYLFAQRYFVKGVTLSGLAGR